MSDLPLWERRFRAPRLNLPGWSREAADRIVFTSNESGIWQVHCLDVSSGARRQVSDHPVGVTEGHASSEGTRVVFWQEDSGDETGRWMAQPFEGGPSTPLLEGVPDGWHDGFAQAADAVATGISNRDGFAIYASVEGGSAKETARSTDWMGIAEGPFGASDRVGLSTDASLLAIQHAEYGDLIHPSLRVLDLRTGAVVAERGDGTEAVMAAAWSPIAGDRRLAIFHEPQDRLRPAIWDLDSLEWSEIAVDLPGDVMPVDWWPDAGSLLLHHAFEGRHELYRATPTGDDLRRLEIPQGTIENARVRPDGSVWFLHTDGMRRARVLDDAGAEPVTIPGDPAPAGLPWTSWRFRNEHGQPVHGFTIEPAGEPPWPVMVFVHGGPHWLYEERYFPEALAYADAGFLVAMPNYRGSTGYGRAWRDALTGDAGFSDVDDVTAGLRDLVDRGLADPARAVVGGWSWGGYITLMQVGRNPDLWRAGVAGVPVGDYVRAYEEEAPTLQALDRGLMGGTPAEVPETYRRSSPLTYVDRVRAPVLFVIGENDSRCPVGQALAYVDALAARGGAHETYLFSTGHGSFVTDEDVRQQAAILAFLHANVPGLTGAPG
jgi:dipeptidyl aminopeptidase/acylaminoacyl peptidase